MNRFLLVSIILISFLAACNPGQAMCDGGLCLEMSIVEPVQALKPALLVLKVTSKEENKRLYIELDLPPEVEYQNLQVNSEGQVEEKTISTVNLITWRPDTSKGKEYILTMDVILPKMDMNARDGYIGSYRFHALADNILGLSISDVITIYMNTDGNQVDDLTVKRQEDSGTWIPLPQISPWPTRTHTNTPTSTNTFTPGPTATSTPAAYPPPSEDAPLVPQETETPKPAEETPASYPPP